MTIHVDSQIRHMIFYLTLTMLLLNITQRLIYAGKHKTITKQSATICLCHHLYFQYIFNFTSFLYEIIVNLLVHIEMSHPTTCIRYGDQQNQCLDNL